MANVASMIELGSGVDEWQYRADLVRTNIEAAQKQAEVLMAAVAVKATEREDIQELLQGILKRFQISLNYFSDTWKRIPRMVIILYVRTEVSIASLQLDLFTSWIKPEENPEIYAALTAQVVEFGHDD
ncbi:MAG: hypothetical protein K8Q97_01115 [Candidatus Andersenbacteria bacterium]|nr:hypothetical protein [Candidatus Andersenbacteria bacterium]